MSDSIDYWSLDDPDYPVADWKYEVANDDTRLGYHAWLEGKRLNAEFDEGGEK